MSKRYKSSEVTQHAICDALKRLMAQKSLSRITISEIMDACGMRRQHFYYYFTDIYDLIRWMFENEALELLRQQETGLSWQEGLLQLFHYIDENRAVCLCALDSLGREYLKKLFETDIHGIVRCAIRQVILENSFPTDEAKEEIISRFLTIATAGVVEGWLRGDLPQTPEELISIFDTMFQDYVCGAELRLRQPAVFRKTDYQEGIAPWKTIQSM